MMQSHSEKVIETLSCPFAICFKNVDWDTVTNIVSTDDKERTVVVDTHEQRYLVNVPFSLYDAIYKSCEKNIIEDDLGFDENY